MSTTKKENQKINRTILEKSGLANLIACASDGIIMLDPDEKIAFWNKASEVMFGYTEKEAAGRKFTGFLLNSEQKELFRESLLISRQNNGKRLSGRKIELEIIKKDKDRSTVNLSFNSLILDDQHYTVMIIHDISNQKKVEDDLRFINEHLLEQTTVIKEMGLQAEIAKGELMLLLDNINIQIWYLTDKETYGAVNKAHAVFIGFSKNQLEYERLSDILPNDKYEKWTEINKRAFDSGKQIHSEELIENSAGEKRIILITMTPSLDETGKIKHVICTGEDITEQKKMERNRIQKEKFKGVLELAGAACHELNQPLQILSGHIKLMQLKSDGDHGRKEKLEIIDEQIERMTEITRRLQNLTSYETKGYLDSKIIDIYKASR